MNDLLNQMAQTISNNFWIAPLIALLAGILTSFTPCSLTTIPLIIGCIGGVEAKGTKKAFKLSLTFALGMAITYAILGGIASSIGSLIQGGKLWYLFLRNTNDTNVTPNLRGIHLYKKYKPTIQKHQKRLCRSNHSRSPWRNILITMFNPSTSSTTCLSVK